MTMAASNAPFVLRWGILATGGIAEKFTNLLLDPATRGVTDVKHVVTAVASSSSVDKARQFCQKVTDGKGDEIKTYGNYEELVMDPNVDIIYVATPHSHHYDNTLLCLEAGKSVCCEKPFTINAQQTEQLIAVAKAKGLFLMEAQWTRFFPLTLELQRLIHKERILGKIQRVHADFGLSFEPDPKHRLFNPDLGGGALLDLGIYPLIWNFLTLYQDPDNKLTAPKVTSTMLKTPLTNVDEFTTVSLLFEKSHTVGLATTNMTVNTPKPGYFCLIQGEKGNITVGGNPFRPEFFTIQLNSSPDKPEKREFAIVGNGQHWEADACARAIRDGKKESKGMTWSESLLLMQVMDQVRAQNDFRYPDALEAVRSK